MKYLLTLLCLLFIGSLARAQQREFMLKRIELPPNFSQQIITGLEQDKLGMLWFITSEGLFRYDGAEVIHLGPETTPSIAHLNIKSLFADKKGSIWVGAQDGMTRLNLNSWTTTRIKTAQNPNSLSLYIRAIGEDRNGRVYAGSQDGIVYCVQKDSLVKVFDMNKAFDNLNDLPNITFIKEAYPGQLWIGTTIGKIIEIDLHKDGSYGNPDIFEFKEFGSEHLINAEFGRNEQCLLVVPGSGLYVFNTQLKKIRKLKGPYSDLGKTGQVFMTPLNKDVILLMTNAPSVGKEKLFLYDFRTDSLTLKELRFPGYLADNHIVWLSHSGSKILLSLNDHLLELEQSTSPFYPIMAETNALNSIRAIYKVPDGPLLAGSYKDGFVSYNEQTGIKTVIDRKYVYSIIPWAKDTVMLSTEGDGLFWYEISKQHMTPIRIPEKQIKGKIMGDFLTFLLRHDHDHVLVGTNERLYMVDPYVKTARSIKEEMLLKTKIQNIIRFGSDYLIATEHGILRWNAITDQIRQFDYNQSIQEVDAHVPVSGMVAVADTVWAATSGYGVIRYDKQGKAIDTLDLTKGLASSVVYSLTQTSRFVMAGTKNGLSVIDKKTAQIKNYSTLDQLPANEFNSNANFRMGSTVYLGTIDGVVHLNTTHLDLEKEKKLEGNIYLTDLSMTSGKGEVHSDYTIPYLVKEGFTIPAGTAYFSIGFGSMDIRMMTLDYYYRLDPTQPWISLGNSKKVTFMGMPPGHYELALAAKLPDGTITDALLHMPFSIAPTFYQTYWFKVLVLIAIIAIIWALMKYREVQAEKERSLRLKIAGDLHDEIGSTLSGMSMQAEMLLSGHVEHQNIYLKSIADNGRAAVQTMGDIVWSIDPRNDDSQSLYQRMERYGHKMLGDLDLSLRFSSKGFIDKQHIPQRIRQNVMLIFKEALTNIIKHSAATQVEVRFDAYHKGFRLLITDNGKGLQGTAGSQDMSTLAGHGLKNMRMRAKNIGAELSFPASNQGFSIELRYKG